MPITIEEAQQHFGTRSIIQEVPTQVGILSNIDRTLTSFANWGLNPEKISTLDFEVATFHVGDPRSSARARLYIILKSIATKRLDPFDIDAIFLYGTYPVAVRLIQLAEKDGS